MPAGTDLRLIAVCCQLRPLPGCAKWSVRDLAAYLEANPELLQASPSRSAIQRLLASQGLKLHRRKYFLQIRDPDFFPKMEHIIQLYQDDPQHLFCLDECTGLQATEKIAPRLPAQPGRPELEEFEYKRNGTASLLAILHKGTGRVFTRCIPDHTSATVAAALAQHAGQFDPAQTLHYICDNYSSHSSEVFCQAVAELCGLQLPDLPTVALRRQWLQSPGKRVVLHFVPTHGSWLNLIEVWFAILQAKALKGQSFDSAEALRGRILEFAQTWNEHFAHPFKWDYTGEGLHDKAIRRFAAWLRIESPELKWGFLDLQLRLMINLSDGYPRKTSRRCWDELGQALSDKSAFIHSLIEGATLPEDKYKDPAKRLQRIEQGKQSLRSNLQGLAQQLNLHC